MMGEDSELEEGELNCSTNEAVVDLDVDLSYIDKKVQNVLGHLRKDFDEESLVRCGPKIGVYGSFLPTYERSIALPLCQRSSLGNHAEQRFSNSLPLPGKNLIQKFQPLRPLPTTFQSPPTTSCNLVASNQDPQNYQTSGSLLAQAPEKVPIKKGNATIPGNGLSDNKPIRLRIKIGSNILSQKVTMVCNDLGLNDSPVSPPRNSHDDSSRMLPHTSLEKTSKSPSHILQEMTAIPVPEDLLMSPLPASLILVKDKEKKYNLLANQHVLKVGKEPSIETQNKFLDVLGCEETPSGRRRKAVDCFGASTWNETSSIGEMKKQKVLSTSQVAREKSTCGVGGESSSSDRLKTKNNLQKGIRKGGESDPRVAFAKSNKTKVVGKHADEEKKTCPTKLKQNSSQNRSGDKFISKMPFKDTTYVGQTSMDTGLDFMVAPSSTSLDLDNWAQCDSCDKWRLLPYGLTPDQLPDKWLCSMQTWLPGMNHCGISEEETINAIKSFHASEAHGTGVKLLYDASNADRSYQSLTCGSLPNPIEKKSNVKEFSQGISNNILGDAAKPMKRLLASKKKPDHKPQLTSGSGSLCTKAHGKINSPVRKIRLMGYKQGQNGNNSKLYADGGEKEPSVEKAITSTISVQESKPHQRNELFQADSSQEHLNDDASCRYFSGGSGQISGVETSSSSKVFGSHKSGRIYVEEVKASPVESVSSSPARSSCPTNLRSAGESISLKIQKYKYGDTGSRIVNNRIPCTSMKTVLENRAGIKNFGAITNKTMDRSCQAANDILQEAIKLRKLADCLKRSGFDNEYKETNFKASLWFLLGGSILEMRSTENVEGGNMSHVEAYQTAAKLSENCAHQYESSQEMAAAALAYKCTEVACMRIVFGGSQGLSGEWDELQKKMVHMTPQGESPSSSASDVDSFNHQGVIDKSAKTKSGFPHVAGNLLPVARSQLNFVPLLDFTGSMNLAMEASAKSQNAFKAASVTSEETKHGDCISAIKKVVDFSFHDVEALIQMTEVAMNVLSSSRFGGPKC